VANGDPTRALHRGKSECVAGGDAAVGHDVRPPVASLSAGHTRAAAARLWQEKRSWRHTDIRVGGYTISAQDPPEWKLVDADRKAQINTLPFPENAVASDEEVHRVMREWVPLAQFGLPEDEYVNGRFLIRHEDLAAHRVDQALSFSEFLE